MSSHSCIIRRISMTQLQTGPHDGKQETRHCKNRAAYTQR